VEASAIAAYIANGVDPAGKVAAALERGADAEERAKAVRDGSWQSLDRAEVSALAIAEARERNVTALERGNELLRLEKDIESGITNELRKQQEIRWATPAYGAGYANSDSARYRP
jgi:urease accessory protein UreF